MSLRASHLLVSLVLVLSGAVLGCQSDADRARELLQQVESGSAGEGVSVRDALVEATTLDPTLREAWTRLADLQLEASQWVEADAAAQRAIALSDTSAHEHEVRARALVALERWADAEPEITREIELGAAEAPARTRLGKVQEHLDRTDDAMASYRRAIELDGTSVEARCALARLLLGPLQTASQDDAWGGDEAGRAEVRALLDAAREPAAETPLAEEVTSLGQDLSALDQRASQLEARRAARELALGGILGALGQMRDTPSPFGDSLGSGNSGVLAALMGDQIGDGFGAGGLGLSGIGVGGGGGGAGETIGLGSIGTIGHGGGGGGAVGFGSGGLGSGALGGGAARSVEPVGPTARVSVSATANGALDAAAITMVARRQSVQLRRCYEQALRVDPALAGTMRIEMTVTATGAAESPHASGLGDETLAACMSRAMGRAAFPPASGATTATVSVACSADE